MRFLDQLKKLSAFPEAEALLSADVKYEQSQTDFHEAASAAINAAMELTETLAGTKDLSRFKVLKESGLLDAPADEMFDSLTQLLCKSIKAPVALIDLIDETRMFIVSSSGITDKSPDYAMSQSWPLEASFCKHVVAQEAPLVIQDARLNELTKNNWATLNGSAIAYMGVPIRVADGTCVGAMCAIDLQPRDWTVNENDILADFTGLATKLINMKMIMNQAS